MNRDESELKRFWKKFWWVVWKDDSFKGWIISLVFLFVVIKLVFFPLLNLVTGTELPLAIVESCSMYHKANTFGNFNNWWERHDSKYNQLNINKTEFSNFVLKKGFNKGDILFIIRAKPEKLEIGNIIIFDSGEKNPIIHRIINIKQEEGKYIFSTIGDNNNGQLSIEKEINEDQLVGKAVLKIMPLLGWGKLIFYERLRTPNERGFCNEQ
ncbi:MAG: signal peptidase I [Candidatus Diapherotrites archaeon]